MQTMDSDTHHAAIRTLGRDAVRVALWTAAILLLPLAAMQFTREVAWTGTDFAAAALLLAGAGLACLRTARRLRHAVRWRRHAALGLLALVFAAVWAELAVGVFFGFGS